MLGKTFFKVRLHFKNVDDVRGKAKLSDYDIDAIKGYYKITVI